MNKRAWLYNLRWEGSKKEPIEYIINEKYFQNIHVQAESQHHEWGLLRWNWWEKYNDAYLGKLRKKSSAPALWEPVGLFLNKTGMGKRAGIYSFGFIIDADANGSDIKEVRILVDLTIQNQLMQQALPFQDFEKEWQELYHRFNVGSLYEVDSDKVDAIMPPELWDAQRRCKDAKAFVRKLFPNEKGIPSFERFDEVFGCSILLEKENGEFTYRPNYRQYEDNEEDEEPLVEENENAYEDNEETENIQFTTGVLSRRVRNSSLVLELKKLHNDQCQVCGLLLQVGPDDWYCEGHHLQPLGSPHNGPDKKENIIILCPNCHVLMDNAVIALDPDKPSVVLHLFDEKQQLAIYPDSGVLFFAHFTDAHEPYVQGHKLGKRYLSKQFERMLERLSKFGKT